MPIHCLVVDDHTLFRAGLCRLLEGEQDLEVVGEASNATDALEKIRDLTPDVVLMDIGMPGLSSFEAARLMVADCPDIRIIFLTMYEDEDYLRQGLEAGAAGYLLKDAPAPNLISAVREVHAGRRYLSPKVVSRLASNLRAHSFNRSTMRGHSLTPREHEVLKMLAEGHSVPQIAVRLRLSVKTVESHKFNLMRKLSIHNKAQLVTYAIQNKIIKMPTEALAEY